MGAPSPFAANTEIPVDKTKGQIEKLLTAHKATAFMNAMSAGKAMIAFEMHGRNIKFVLPLPARDNYKSQPAFEQATRTRWRALHLALKAKLEMVATGIMTFEDEFLANIMMADGHTVGEIVRPNIALSYESGTVRPLLEGPKG